VATNAGGSYFYRYGSLAANLLGVQVVTAAGDILDLNYTRVNCPKNNTGYKLHQLLIGSEGTLGVVTGVALQCHPLLRNQQTVLLACDNFAHILSTLRTAQTCLGEILAAAEWMDGATVDLVQQTHPSLAVPLLNDNKSSYPHYLLLETHGSSVEHDAAKMEVFLEQILGVTTANGILAESVQQQQQLWQLREAANPAVGATGYTYKYDLSLPDSQFDEFIDEMRERLSDDDVTVVNANWGHVLDGNLHFNVTTPGQYEKDAPVLAKLEPHVFQAVHRRGGSISAEHGIGQAKVQYMTMVHSDAVLQTMRALKQVWDPVGILNPGKVLPPV